MPIARVLLIGLAFCCFRPALADTVNRVAENDIPVTMTEVVRTQRDTIVRLRAEVAMENVCWYNAGANAPYLLAGGRRYRLTGGEGIAICPQRRGYTAHQIMVLHFELLDPTAREVSLVEGQGGENQMIDPKSSSERFWNFLHVYLK
jgi:hypothetical protein